MKKSISIFILSLFTIVVRADDGMWLPFLLDQSQMHDMQAAGCRMTAEDIYSVNHTSMKDAVLLFGGGCTGEMISGEGLLLTNHHCGFGYVQEHSDINHDYVKNGFWAMNKKEEYQCAGLSVTFIVSMEDVTEKMLRGIGNITDDAKKNLVIDSMSHAISIQAIAGTKYGASVRPIYYGNQFILIVSQTFNDVRLVGAPPENVGNFGGDDENWMWPRHTGDFSLFRIYADKNNEPAVYSADNIPYQPKYFFPISIKGINEGDFAMVYGFPGRTTEYISSYAVDFTQKITDPDRVKIRTIKLNLWMDAMQQSDTVNLHYATKYSGIANGWKKWQGEMDGLQRFKVVDMKKKSEDSLIQIIHFDKSLSVYSNVLSELKTAYDTLDEYQHIADYYNEALKGSEVISFAEKWLDVIDESNIPESVSALDKKKSELKSAATVFFKNYDLALDKKVTEALLKIFITDMKKENVPDELASGLLKFNSDVHAYAEYLFSKSALVNYASTLNAIESIHSGKKLKIVADPLILLARSIDENYALKYQPVMTRLFARINLLSKQYMEVQLLAYNGKKKFFPDANSTLRFSYGKVAGYYPKDAEHYNWFTTADGLKQKNDPHSMLYAVPSKLLSLIQQKDFGQYANASGELNTCFITTCHTTGGNSGSPVLDANGNLIGTNFDRVWEGTMSDIYFNSEVCRNVSVDVRYTLFLIDKFAGAGYLLNEMKILK